MSYNKIRTSAKAIILRDGQILLIRKRGQDGIPYHVIPGGGQNHGENLHQALQRECIEEVNAPVQVGPLRYVQDYIANHHEFSDVHPDAHHVVFFFECSVPSDYHPAMGTETDTHQEAVLWFPLNCLEEANLYPKALIPHLQAFNVQGPVYLGDCN